MKNLVNGQKVRVFFYVSNRQNKKSVAGTVEKVHSKSKVDIQFTNGSFTFTKATDKVGAQHEMWDVAGKGVFITSAN